MLTEEITKAEPLAEQKKERFIVIEVFLNIVLGTLKDIFQNTAGVFWKYIKHLILCLHYFWSPDMDRPPFSKLDFKEFCKHSFEGVVLSLLISIFTVKVGWLAPTNEAMKDKLGNDLFQMRYETFMFIGFAATYFLLVSLSVFSGRVLRRWLTPEVTVKESDLLMVTFFNSFFSLTALTALIIRITVPFQDNELDEILTGVGIILFFTCLLLTILWAIRFLQLNSVKGLKVIPFFIIAVVLYTVMFTIGGIITTGLLYVV